MMPELSQVYHLEPEAVWEMPRRLFHRYLEHHAHLTREAARGS